MATSQEVSPKPSKIKKRRSFFKYCSCISSAKTDDRDDTSRPYEKPKSKDKLLQGNAGIEEETMGKAESKPLMKGEVINQDATSKQIKPLTKEKAVDISDVSFECNDNPNDKQNKQNNATTEDGLEIKDQVVETNVDLGNSGSEHSSYQSCSDNDDEANKTKEDSSRIEVKQTPTETETEIKSIEVTATSPTIDERDENECLSCSDDEIGEDNDKESKGDEIKVPSPSIKRELSKKITNPLKKMKSKIIDAVSLQKFDTFTPEVCIELMKSTPATLKFLSHLNKRLKQNDSGWNGEFLDLDGGEALLDLVEVIGVRRVTNLSDALLLLECVQCVKTLMNSKLGLAYLVEHGDSLVRLVRGRLLD